MPNHVGDLSKIVRAAAARGATAGRGLLRITLAALLAAAGSAEATAQETGRIMGRVVNAQTGEPLAAVQVSIPSLSRGTLSDSEGRYVLLGIPAGTHDLVAESLGYGRKTITGVETPAGRAVTLDVALDPAAVEVEGVTVSATRERGSTTSLLSDRRRAADVSDAIGAEQIARAPDGDVAAALKRVPGVTVVDGKYVYVRGLGERYGATTLNGAPMPSPLPDRKAVPLDVIPSELLESVVTAKSYLPDQPGDYAGGLVQIRTRSVPTSRIFQLSTSVGYNTTSSLQESLGFGGGAGLLGMADGSLHLPQNIFEQERVALPSDGAGRTEMARALTQRFGPARMQRPLNQSYGATFGDQLILLGRAIGVVGTVTTSESHSAPDDAVERFFVAAGDEPRDDYDFAVTGGSRETSLGSLVSLSAEVAPAQRVTFTATFNRLTDDQARKFAGLYTGGDYFETYNTRYVSSAIGTAQLSGDHVLMPLGRSIVNWRASFGRADREEPGTRTAAYRGTGPGEPVYFLPSQSSGVVLAQRLDEDLFSGAASLKVPFSFRGSPASLAIGGSADLRDRDVRTRRILLTPVDHLAAVQDLPPELLFVPERIGSESGQLMVSDRTFAADNYVADQSVLAGYASVDAELLPRLRFVGGVRVEQAEQAVDVTGFRPGEDPGIPGARLDDTDLIPAVSLTYAVTETMNFRAAISRTLARPQFRELSPFLYADYFGDVPVRGNPFLVRSRILNTDARWEWFPAAGAVLSAGAFHKEFTDPIEPIAMLLGTNPGRTFANTESATVYGAELEVRAPLGVVAEALGGFTINGNLTVARSAVGGDEVSIYDPQRDEPLVYPVNRGADRPLFGQSPYAVNLGVTYFHERTGTAGTLLFNRFGRRVDTTGGVALPDIYEEGRSQLDLTLEQPLAGGLAMKLSTTRLLGGDVEFTQTFPNGDVVTTRRYDLGRMFSMSLNWKP